MHVPRHATTREALMFPTPSLNTVYVTAEQSYGCFVRLASHAMLHDS